MNPLLFILLLPVAIATSTFAGTVTLAWTGSQGTNAYLTAGYNVHYGPATGTYTNYVDAGTNLTTLIGGLVDNSPYFFMAAAYDTNANESVPSNEISYVITNAPFPSIMLSVASVTAKTVSLAWTCTNVTRSFLVTMTPDHVTVFSWNVGTNTTFTLNSGLKPNNTYYFQVSSTDPNGIITLSNEASVRTHPVPTAPTSLVVVTNTP